MNETIAKSCRGGLVCDTLYNENEDSDLKMDRKMIFKISHPDHTKTIADKPIVSRSTPSQNVLALILLRGRRINKVTQNTGR